MEEFTLQDKIITAMGAIATSIVAAVGEATRRRAKRTEDGERERSKLAARQEIKIHANFDLAMLTFAVEMDDETKHRRAQEIKVKMLEDLVKVGEMP